MVETSIDDFHTILYIPEIKKIVFHLPHVQIISTDHCGNTLCEAFKRLKAYQNVLCYHDCAYKVVSSLAH